MATRYYLNFRNNAVRPGSFCVYATSPDTQAVQTNLVSLAWFSIPVNPGTSANFEWDLNYSFVWSKTGMLVPGVRFRASEIKAADPKSTTQNKAYLDIQNNAYLFGDSSLAIDPSPGALGITVSSSVPNNDASVGIAIGGKAALIVEAGPNLRYNFMPKIKYWVAYGNFIEGEVLDLNTMTAVHELVYPTNVYDKTVILNDDNTWSEDRNLFEKNEIVRNQRSLKLS